MGAGRSHIHYIEEHSKVVEKRCVGVMIEMQKVKGSVPHMGVQDDF